MCFFLLTLFLVLILIFGFLKVLYFCEVFLFFLFFLLFFYYWYLFFSGGGSIKSEGMGNCPGSRGGGGLSGISPNIPPNP